MNDAGCRTPFVSDPDRLLLLTIAVVLVQNHAPTPLVLALLYAAI